MISDFLQWEEESGLFNLSFDGFSLWPYVRMNVYMRMATIKSGQKPVPERTESKLHSLPSVLRNLTLQNPCWRAKKADVLFITHQRRSRCGNTYECLYTDELASALGERAESAEFMFGLSHFSPPATKRLLYLDYIDILPALHSRRVKKKKTESLAQIRESCKRIDQSLTEKFGFSVGEDFLFSRASRRFLWHQMKKPMLFRLLKRVSPKVIVEVVGYETDKMILNEAAREMGIPTIELQHGVIGRGHIAYNYAEKRSDAYLPDYILLFSEYWKKTASFALPEDHLIPVGFPYQERMMQQYPRRMGEAGCIRILVLSQPEFSAKLRQDIGYFLALLDENKMIYSLTYKLHPAEFRGDLSPWEEMRKNPQVTIVDTPDIGLYQCFAEADVQIGVTSTALFEGLAYQLKTFILHYEKTDEYMGDLCRLQYAQMAENGEELFHMLQTAYGGNTDGEMTFFETNAKEHILQIINKQCGGCSDGRRYGS